MSAQPQLVAISAKKVATGNDAKQTLKQAAANEYVFAVVGPAGSGTSWVAKALQTILDSNGFQADILKASSVIESWAEKHGYPIDESSKLERAKSLQDLGDRCRLESNDLAAVAIRLMQPMRELRKQSTQRRAYIIDSLKHPAETALLRQVYQDAFCQIGVVCSEEIRKDRLRQAKCSDSTIPQIESFMRRDEDAIDDHGQKVTKTFHLSDFFVDNTPPRFLREANTQVPNPKWDVSDQLGRLVDILTHTKIVRPRPSETGMFHAHGSAMRSACLSRQVGAALMDAAGNVVATGTNEVPRAGGGLYGGGFRMDVLNDHEYDHRCAVAGGHCRNAEEQRTIIQEIINDIPELKAIDDGESLQKKLAKTRVGRLVEFSRAVHAEMDALLSAGRQGTSTVGTRMFVTTFPCHYCARHIVAAGVDEVQFIEPYPKSRALSLHGDAIVTDGTEWQAPSETVHNASDGKGHPPPYVLFRPFTGVAPRLYKRAFLKDRELKDSAGKMSFGDSDASIRPELLRISYIDVEEQLIKNGGHDD
ncbi:anti-phage dCTP deaminase [Paraburkholderia sp. J94]|uniref:anti-phage dCTP deaminase n=1 Tax=Paraburkholderia sp. J94 TaxID=2805441 RepID=UPI002AB2690A|nr:anti-phage dCTP deaminase [Paraburkholderia sp. J94]